MPCVMYRLDDSVQHLRVVVLVAARTIEAGEELIAYKEPRHMPNHIIHTVR